ncbi:MAG: Spx/MgsR family RNA polymerase-binding regulatory protein [Opitutae bacterium]
MKFKFYEYEKCSTCVKARKWLEFRGINFERIPIREQPPSIKELQQLVERNQGMVKKLFNTSSKDYRDPKIKDSLPNWSLSQAIEILRSQGNLIKRPVLVGSGLVLQGFKAEEWESELR